MMAKSLSPLQLLGWRGSYHLLMELPEEDLKALRELVTNGQARPVR
jgi:hypothetical protein